jgi:penicillin-binding protein 1A
MLADGRRYRRIIKWLGLGLVLAVAGAMVTTAGVYAYVAPSLPDVARLQDVHLQQPLRIHAANGDLMATYGAKRRLPVDIEQVPRQFRNAFIAAEDDRFYDHPGVDWMGIARAAWHLVRTGEKTQGGSTITMQVARNFFLSQEKTYIRKIREIFLALQIHAELTKDEVLELYMNKIYLGEGAYGIAAAARTYYGKDIDQLTLDQMATIAGLPRAPAYYNPADHPQRARGRRNYVLRRMFDNGMIDRRTLDHARAQPVRASEHAPPIEVDAPYAASMARRQAVARLGEEAYTRGYSVYTSVVPAEQEAAAEAVRSGLRSYARRHGYVGPIAHHDTSRLPAVRRVKTGNGAQSGPMTADEPSRDTARRSLDRLLAEHPLAGDLQPAVVLRVESDRAHVYRRDGGLAQIPWQAMQWAAPRRSDGGTGPQPEAPADVLAAGDVVYVAGRAQDSGVELAQRPRVEGALAALDPHDGAIRALVGGFDFAHGRFNRAVQARRQPGSTFKPFVYSAALDHGFTAATMVNDAPVVFDAAELGGAWRPENYSGRVFGPTRLREGLVHSRNLVSIRVLRRIGLPHAIDHVQRFGFSAERLPHDLTLALGSASVSPLQMTRAYAVFANMGYRVEPYLITRIADASGAAIYRANPAIVCDADCRRTRREAADDGANGRVQPIAARDGSAESRARKGQAGDRYAPRAITRENAYLMRSFLRDVARRGTAQCTRVLGRDDIGAKTGTTNQQRDAWFAGFNSSLVATTWVGFDQGRSLGRHETGARAAMPIWLDFMRETLAGTPERWPARPDGMVTVRIDPRTGRYASPGNDDAVFEIFRAHNAPEPHQASPDRQQEPLF